MKSMLGFLAKAKRPGVLLAVLALVILGFSSPALAVSTLSPATSLAHGPVLTEEDDEDSGGKSGKKKKVAVGTGIGTTLLAIVGFVFRWSRRAHKVYKIGRGAVRTGQKVQRFRQNRRGDDQPPGGYRH